MVLVCLVCLVISSAQLSAAERIKAHSEEECMAVAFVLDTKGHHISMISNSTVQFGTDLIIESDCGPFNVTYSGVTFSSDGGYYSDTIDHANREILIQGDGWELNYTNLRFYPTSNYDDIVGYWDNLPPPDGDYMTENEKRTHEFFVALVSVVLAWIVSLMVVDRITGAIIERQTGREVID